MPKLKTKKSAAKKSKLKTKKSAANKFKLSTKKSAVKRFGVTASGKIKKRKSGTQHNTTKNSPREKRTNYSYLKIKADEKNITRQLLAS